jgi:CheY-like chemotaxis protein
MTATTDATVLIVDDSPENLHVLGELLRPHYRVPASISGEGALRLAGSQPKPDLILFDVMMPGMDGYAVPAQLQADPVTRGRTARRARRTRRATRARDTQVCLRGGAGHLANPAKLALADSGCLELHSGTIMLMTQSLQSAVHEVQLRSRAA